MVCLCGSLIHLVVHLFDTTENPCSTLNHFSICKLVGRRFNLSRRCVLLLFTSRVFFLILLVLFESSTLSQLFLCFLKVIMLLIYCFLGLLLFSLHIFFLAEPISNYFGSL